MRHRACACLIALLGLALSGCLATTPHATATPGVRLASAAEHSCKHCNCFMPADIDPGVSCPVCNCGKRAAECYRGR